MAATLLFQYIGGGKSPVWPRRFMNSITDKAVYAHANRNFIKGKREAISEF